MVLDWENRDNVQEVIHLFTWHVRLQWLLSIGTDIFIVVVYSCTVLTLSIHNNCWFGYIPQPITTNNRYCIVKCNENKLQTNNALNTSISFSSKYCNQYSGTTSLNPSKKALVCSSMPRLNRHWVISLRMATQRR